LELGELNEIKTQEVQRRADIKQKIRDLIVRNEQCRMKAEAQQLQMKVKLEHKIKLNDEISKLEEAATHIQNETDKITRQLENNLLITNCLKDEIKEFKKESKFE